MRIRFLIVVLVVAGSAPAGAQTVELPPTPVAHPSALAREQQGGSSDHGTPFTLFLAHVASSFVQLPSRETAVTLGLGGALALAVHPLDRTLTRRANQSAPLDEVLEFGNIGGTGWTQAGLAAA